MTDVVRILRFAGLALVALAAAGDFISGCSWMVGFVAGRATA